MRFDGLQTGAGEEIAVRVEAILKAILVTEELLHPFGRCCFVGGHVIHIDASHVHVASDATAKQQVAQRRFGGIALFEYQLNVQDRLAFGFQRFQTGGEPFGAWNQMVFQFGHATFAGELNGRFVLFLCKTCAFGIQQQL